MMFLIKVFGRYLPCLWVKQTNKMAEIQRTDSVNELQNYLKDRGIIVFGMKKDEVVDLVMKAKQLNVEVDPDDLIEDRNEVEFSTHQLNETQIISTKITTKS